MYCFLTLYNAIVGVIQEVSKRRFSRCRLPIELPFGRQLQMFPFHKVTFGLFIPVLDPHFFPSNNRFQKVFTFAVIVIPMQISKNVCVCSIVGSSRNHFAWDLKGFLLCIISYLQPWLVRRQVVTSSKTTFLFFTVMAQRLSVFSSAFDAGGRVGSSAALFTLMLFSKLLFHSYTLRFDNALLIYCAEGLRRPCVAHRNRTIACCSFVVHTTGTATVTQLTVHDKTAGRWMCVSILHARNSQRWQCELERY